MERCGAERVGHGRGAVCGGVLHQEAAELGGRVEEGAAVEGCQLHRSSRQQN